MPGGPDSGGGGGPDSGGGGQPDGGGGGIDASPPGAACGGLGGVVCGPTEYCDYGEDDCGADDGQGTCQPRPFGCPDLYFPTCACDGMVYGNSCDAAAAGYDINNWGCTAPPGQFACGAHFCNHGLDYCQRQVSDVAGYPDEYQCIALPAACGATATCPCLAAEPCGTNCTTGAPGDLTLTCPGG